jgi:antitoxin (DNA-binding transcriptional repressor) of toxin-antitoxin stability system
LIKKVVNGGEVIIAKGNIPLVKLVSIASYDAKRKVGSAQGIVTISKTIDEPLEDFTHRIAALI